MAEPEPVPHEPSGQPALPDVSQLPSAQAVVPAFARTRAAKLRIGVATATPVVPQEPSVQPPAQSAELQPAPLEQPQVAFPPVDAQPAAESQPALASQPLASQGATTAVVGTVLQLVQMAV